MSHSLRKGRTSGCAFRKSAVTAAAVVAAVIAATVATGTAEAQAAGGGGSPTLRALSVVPEFPATGRAEAPLVLRLPGSARQAALANVGIAANDADALFYSPGMLLQARGVSVSVQRYGGRATTGSYASVQTIGPFAIGVGAQHLDYRTAHPDDYAGAVQAGAPPLADGGPYTASSSAFTVGVGRMVRGFRAGVHLKYVEDRLGSARDGTLAADVGISRQLGFATFAAALQNIGQGLSPYDFAGRLPTRLTVGYGGGLFPLNATWDLGFQTQVAVERDGFVRPAGGVELAYVPIEGVAVVLRNGLRLPRERDEPLVTAGLGVTVDRFSLDYAMEPMRGGRAVSHRLGVRVR